MNELGSPSPQQVNCLRLNEERLRRLERHDPSVAGLTLDYSDLVGWDGRLGWNGRINRVIGSSEFLKEIRVVCESTTNIWFDQDMCTALANLIIDSATSSIRTFRFSGHFLDDIDCFAILSNALMGFGNTLEHLEFSSIMIYAEPDFIGPDDDCVISLGESLAVMNVLKSLDLHSINCFDITLEGWRGLSKCLKNDQSSLYHLNLQGCAMNDEGAGVIFMSLVGNSCLKKLWLTENHMITEEIWKVVLHVLCDRSSIGSILYSSNHTFQKLWIDLPIPEDIAFLLTMHRNEGKSDIIRRKILNHFSGEGDDNAQIHIFAQMSESMMPFALNWIGRDHFGFSLMYAVVRDIPQMFDSALGQPHLRASKRKKC